MGLPPDLGFRIKGQLAIDVCAAAYTDGIRFDFACGDEVYGNCTQLGEFFETRGQATYCAYRRTSPSPWPGGRS